MHSETDRPAVTFPNGSGKKKKRELKQFFQTVPMKPYSCYRRLFIDANSSPKPKSESRILFFFFLGKMRVKIKYKNKSQSKKPIKPLQALAELHSHRHQINLKARIFQLDTEKSEECPLWNVHCTLRVKQQYNKTLLTYKFFRSWKFWGAYLLFSREQAECRP